MNEEQMVLDETLEVQDNDVYPENTSKAEELNTESSIDIEALKKEAELAKNYKIRAEKAERELRAKRSNPSDSLVDSIDLIKLGKELKDYDNDELDFVTEFAKSKDPREILKALENPFVKNGINAHREKLQKELTMSPSSRQAESDRPRSLMERLANASIEEKEKILSESGYYKSPRPKLDRVNIGTQR